MPDSTAGPAVESSRPTKQLKFKTGFTNVVLDVFLALGWRRAAEDEEWDVYWCEVGWVHDMPSTMQLSNSARVCHFPTHLELTRKDRSVTNMKRYRKKLEREVGKTKAVKSCSFMPETFYLPGEYHMFVELWKKSPSTAWIMKPVGRAQGKGIFLFRKLEDIVAWKKDTRFEPRDESADKRDAYIVQEYISNPYLIGGKKFDLRFYVLVTSYSPMEVWLYRQGFARFSGYQFSMDNIADSFVHLTNVAVQKTAEGYDKAKGCKMLFTDVKALLRSRHGDAAVKKCLEEIDNVFITSLLSVQPMMSSDRRCFELYGYDILLDTDLKPWLIEVNASPSMTADTPSDYNMKFGLLEDCFGVVDPEGKRAGNRPGEPQDLRVGGFDLVWADGKEVTQPSRYGDGEVSPLSNSNLGGYMGDRKENLLEVMGARKLPQREWVSAPAPAAKPSKKSDDSSDVSRVSSATTRSAQAT
eukprot:m.267058 g.267058  ORF g.267058 m.267058 type:complete len:469 (+) comp16040_c0_seq8:239-1645(+)